MSSYTYRLYRESTLLDLVSLLTVELRDVVCQIDLFSGSFHLVIMLVLSDILSFYEELAGKTGNPIHDRTVVATRTTPLEI